MKYNYKNIVKTIISLNTRKFGDVGEIIITKIIKGLQKSDDLSYDKKLGDQKLEIKFSRALKNLEPITEKNICEALLGDNESRLVSDKNKNIEKWDCNIQQIKVKCFDVLYYGIFFREQIYIFKIIPNQIIEDKTIRYSDKQHRGNTGEGQFHIGKKNIDYHIKNFLYKKMNYKELWELLNE